MEEKKQQPKPTKKQQLTAYAITLTISSAVAVLLAAILGGFAGEWTKHFCDAFFVVAAVLASVTTLRLMGGKGAYDSLSYAGRWLNPFKRKDYINYGDYADKKEAARANAPKKSYLAPYLAAATLFVICIVFLIIYYV